MLSRRRRRCYVHKAPVRTMGNEVECMQRVETNYVMRTLNACMALAALIFGESESAPRAHTHTHTSANNTHSTARTGIPYLLPQQLPSLRWKVGGAAAIEKDTSEMWNTQHLCRVRALSECGYESCTTPTHKHSQTLALLHYA